MMICGYYLWYIFLLKLFASWGRYMSSSIWFLASIMEKLIRVTLRNCQSMIRMCFVLSPSTSQTRNSRHYLRWLHHYVILSLFLHKTRCYKVVWCVFTKSILYYSEGLSINHSPSYKLLTTEVKFLSVYLFCILKH